MPLKLIPPDPKRTPFYRIRGTLHGVYLDRSCQTADQREARALLKGWERQILRGAISGKQELTFYDAAQSYSRSRGSSLFLDNIVRYFGQSMAAKDVNQSAIDRAAQELYPSAGPATRNRQIYTPISAVLRHANIAAQIKRPKGAQGNQRTRFLSIDEFDRLEATTRRHEPELAALFTLLTYTGLRLSEALSIERKDLDLQNAKAFVQKTKNGLPRMVYLPPRVVVSLANVPKLTMRHDRLFRWSKSGLLYVLAEVAYSDSGIDHCGAPFHCLRHTFATWSAGLSLDVVRMGAWKSHQAARGYQHFVVSEEAAKADLLPGARRTK